VEEISSLKELTCPIISMVFHGDRTRKFRSLGPLDALPPMNNFRKGSKTPAISKIEVKVFSNIRAETCNSKRVIVIRSLHIPQLYMPKNIVYVNQSHNQYALSLNYVLWLHKPFFVSNPHLIPI